MILDPANELAITALLAPVAETATFSVTGIDLQQYEGQVAVVIEIGTVSGTTPSLTVDLLSGDASNGSGAAAFSTDINSGALTASGQTILTFDKRSAGRYLKITGTITGTTPSFTMGIVMIGGKAATASTV